MYRSAGLLALELEFGLVAASASTAKTLQVYQTQLLILWLGKLCHTIFDLGTVPIRA